MKKALLVASIAILLMPVMVFALAIPADMTGNRTTSSGVTATDDWVNNFSSISWNITLNGKWYHYEYTISASKPSVSHFVLEVSPTVTEENFDSLFKNFSGSTIEGPDIITQKNYDGKSVYGIKFDWGTNENSITYSFDSLRSPIWGDFIVKGGQSLAYNTGIGTDPTSSPFTNWIATPDTVGVPEPGTLLLLGAGLLGIGALRRARRQRKLQSLAVL
jgi:opacity protein-like surface antigen